MGRRRSAVSLKQICIDSITGSMDIWCEDYIKNYMGKYSFLYIIGPFEELTSCQIKDIISALVTKRMISKIHLNLLLHSRVEQLDLSGCSKIINDEMIFTIAARCLNIKHLNLTSCNRVTGRAFQRLALSLTQAVSLNFTGTKCSNEALKLIVQICSKLRELNLHGVKVQDDIMYFMCQVVQRGEGCVKLQSLDIFNTFVSGNAVIAIINHLPEIKHINWINIFGAFEEGLQKEGHFEQGCNVGLTGDKPCQLRSLIADSSFPEVTNTSIYLACIHCPHTNRFVLAGPSGFDHTGLQHITVLKHLEHLTLSGQHDTINFSHLIKILSKLGPNLRTLNLQDIDDIDMYAVALHCPELVKFTVDVRSLDYANFVSESEVRGQRSRPFSKLRELALYSKEENLSTDAMVFLISNSHQVEVIDVIHVSAFNDTALFEAFHANKCHSLRKLRVFSCNELSIEPVLHVLSDKLSVIEELRLLECRNISRRNSDKVARLIKRENLDVVYEWT